MVNYKTLRATNAAFDENRVLDYESLAEGGSKFERRIQRFVTRGLLDVDAVYQQKCEVAKQCLNNYFSQILNYYTGFLFDTTFEVYNKDNSKLSDYYLELQENCDGVGTNLHDFVRDVFTSALTGKRSLITLELPDVPDVELTRKQFEELNLNKPYLKKYCSSEVVDWGYDATGNLEWVKTRVCSTYKETWASQEYRVETYKIYTPTYIETYVIMWDSVNDSPHDLKEYDVSTVVYHNLGVCPAIMIDLPDNYWLGDKVSPAQKRNLNDEITAKWAVNKGVYSMPVLKVENREDAEKVYSLNRTGIVLGAKDSAQMLEPLPEHARVAREACRSSKDEIFRVAHLKQLSQENNSYWRTGSAVALDSSSAHTALRIYGSIAKEVILKIFNLIAKARVEDLTFNVIGFESFDLLDPEALMKISLDATKIPLPPTARNLLAKQTALSILKDLTAEEKQKIRSEEPEMMELQTDPVAESDDEKDNEIGVPTLNDEEDLTENGDE